MNLNLITGYLKAHLAGLTAAVTLALADMANPGGLHTVEQWSAIVAAYLAGAAIVAVTPNTPATPTPGA